MNQDNHAFSAQAVRETPVPPGGGSWIWDSDRWEWIDNNPKPAPAEQTSVADDQVDADIPANQE